MKLRCFFPPFELHACIHVSYDVSEMILNNIYMKSSDAKASKCQLKFSYKMIIFYQACIFKFSNFT